MVCPVVLEWWVGADLMVARSVGQSGIDPFLKSLLCSERPLWILDSRCIKPCPDDVGGEVCKGCGLGLRQKVQRFVPLTHLSQSLLCRGKLGFSWWVSLGRGGREGRYLVRGRIR